MIEKGTKRKDKWKIEVNGVKKCKWGKKIKAKRYVRDNNACLAEVDEMSFLEGWSDILIPAWQFIGSPKYCLATPTRLEPTKRTTEAR